MTFANDILDETEVAAMLACEPSTVQAMARERQLPGVKFGRSWRFPRVALLEVLNRKALSNTAPAEPPAPTAVAKAPAQTKRKQPPALPALSN